MHAGDRGAQGRPAVRGGNVPQRERVAAGRESVHRRRMHVAYVLRENRIVERQRQAHPGLRRPGRAREAQVERSACSGYRRPSLAGRSTFVPLLDLTREDAQQGVWQHAIDVVRQFELREDPE